MPAAVFDHLLRPSDKDVLIAPLNWGLGHASRCIPLIRYWKDEGRRIRVASDGVALDLLQREFPDVDFVELPPYDVRYAFRSMAANMLWQGRRLFQRIRDEEAVIKHLVDTQAMDVIVSDNRFGCRHPRVKSIFMTHQIHIPAHTWMERKVANALNRQWIRRFDECWIPDTPDHQLAGRMSQAGGLSHVRYIGPLSRFQALTRSIIRPVLIVLSGPEPQRTRLETVILDQGHHLPKDSLLVRGTIRAMMRPTPASLQVVDLMTSEALNEAIVESEIVVCRAGYSSIMDLVALNKRAVLIPTPGQPEQMYLATHLQHRPQFMMVHQKNLDLPKAIHGFEQR